VARSLAEWLALQEAAHPKSIDLGLARVGEVARRLGIERPGSAVITVGGTNGKGSTVAHLEALAEPPAGLVLAHLLHLDGIDLADPVGRIDDEITGPETKLFRHPLSLKLPSTRLGRFFFSSRSQHTRCRYHYD